MTKEKSDKKKDTSRQPEPDMRKVIYRGIVTQEKNTTYHWCQPGIEIIDIPVESAIKTL